MEWLSKDLIQLAKDNIISIVIVLYLLYKNGIISFKNNDGNDNESTNNNESTSSSENSKNPQIDVMSLLQENMEEIRDVVKDLKDKDLTLVKHDAIISQHEKVLDNITNGIEELKHLLDELRNEYYKNSSDIKVIQTNLENIEYKILVLKDKIQSIETDIKDIKEEQRNNKFMGDLKNGFR